jgi:hypothetical protein
MSEVELNQIGTSEETGFQSVAENRHCRGGSYVGTQTKHLPNPSCNLLGRGGTLFAGDFI